MKSEHICKLDFIVTFSVVMIMKLVVLLFSLLVTASVAVDVSALEELKKCEEKPGFYYGPDSKGNMTCIKACDEVKNEVVLFGRTYPCNTTTELCLPAGATPGTIPQSIVGLTKLTSLCLSYNRHFSSDYRQLTGTIPNELGRLTELNFLSLGGGIDGLIGTIPQSIVGLTK